MDRSRFFFDQNVQADEMNGIFDKAEDAEQHLGYEAGGYGVVSGLTLSPGGGLTVNVSAGVARCLTNGKAVRAVLTALRNVAVNLDVNGGLCEVAIGHERWIRVRIAPATVESDDRLDGSGSPVKFAITEDCVFEVLRYTEAVIGDARRDLLLEDEQWGDGYTVLGDALLQNTGTGTAVTQIDYGFRMDYGRSIKTTLSGASVPRYSLLWSTNRSGANPGAGTARLYAVDMGGLVLTLNAKWDPQAALWRRDYTNREALAYYLTSDPVAIYTEAMSSSRASWTEFDWQGRKYEFTSGMLRMANGAGQSCTVGVDGLIHNTSTTDYVTTRAVVSSTSRVGTDDDPAGFSLATWAPWPMQLWGAPSSVTLSPAPGDSDTNTSGATVSALRFDSSGCMLQVVSNRSTADYVYCARTISANL